MPSQKIEYTILLSSPSDLPEERRAAIEIVSQVATLWGHANNAVLKVLSWESDVPPNFGSEPQDVINRKLGESWDIYLGIMHARFGTPTKNFGSGTEEEFERAYSLWKVNQAERMLMFYFKRDSIAFDQIDTEQINKVRAFQKKVSSLGGLYREFTGIENFTTLWRAHLTNVLTELHKLHTSKLIESKSKTESKAVTIASPNAINDQGILDFFATIISGSSEMTGILNKIAEIMNNATSQIKADTVAMGQAGAIGDINGLRKVFTSISNSMIDLAKKLGDERRHYSMVSRKTFDALSYVISFAVANHAKDFKNITGIVEVIKTLVIRMESFTAAIEESSGMLNGQTNYTQDFNVARLVLKREFINLRSEVNASVNLLKDLIMFAEENTKLLPPI